MITNFEEITEDISAEELEAVPVFLKGMEAFTKDKPIKAPQLCAAWNRSNQKINMTEVRLRKLINYIRSNGLAGMVGTSRGYYVSSNPEELTKQILSLRQRARSIDQSADGLEKFLNKTQ